MSEKDLTRLTNLDHPSEGSGPSTDADAAPPPPPSPTLTLDDFPSLEEQTAKEAAKSKTPMDLGYLDEKTGQIVLKNHVETKSNIDIDADPEAAAGPIPSEPVPPSPPLSEQPMDLQNVGTGNTDVGLSTETASIIAELPAMDFSAPDEPSAPSEPAAPAEPSPPPEFPAAGLDGDFVTPEPLSFEAEPQPIDLGPKSSVPEGIVYAPPASAHHLKSGDVEKSGSETKTDLSEIKKFSSNLAIGAPRVEANPPYTFSAKTEDGSPFNERATKAIMGALSSDDYGVRPEDVEIQLRSGRFFVPRISEFAAITLVQKLRDVIETINVRPSGAHADSDESEQAGQFLTKESHEHQKKQESWSIANQPQKEEDVFATTQTEPSGFKVQRILGVVSATEIIDSALASNPQSVDFEKVTERLTKQLIAKGYRLGANGVLAISFNIYPVGTNPMGIPSDQSPSFRVLGTGTAVSGKPA